MKAITALLFAAALGLVTSCLAADSERAYARELKITPLLKTQTDGAGRPLVYPGGTPEVTGVLVEVPPGVQTNWHKHPEPCFAYMVEGELQVELVSGEVRTFKAGEAFAEVVELLHNGVNRTQVPAKLVMFVVGAAGQPYAVKAPAPARSP